MSDETRRHELETILDDVSYEITSVRAAGFDRPDDAVSTLDRIAKKIADARSLVAGFRATASAEQPDLY